MKNLFPKITDYLKEIFSNKISYEEKGMEPHSDWGKILFSTVIVAIILIGISLFFYFEIDKNRLFNSADITSESEIKVNTTLLTKITGDLKNNQAKFEDLKTSKNIPPDPSL